MANRGIGKTLRIMVDALLAVCFIAVMATALVEEVPHEFLGIVLFVLMIVHIVINRRWFASLSKGRYTAVRVLQLISIAGLVVCVVGQIVSALILSKHVLAFLPTIPGASWARRVHMLCSYWSFMFAFAHMGLQFKGMLARMGGVGSASSAAVWAFRIAWAAIAVFGAASFVRLGIAGYLFAQAQFAAGYDMPLVMSLVLYAAMAVLIAGCFHYLRLLIEQR